MFKSNLKTKEVKKVRLELFTADCPLCEETIEMVKNAKCDECTLIEYNLVERCEDETCLAKVKKYGIKAIPSLVVDGKLAIEGKPTVARVKEVLNL